MISLNATSQALQAAIPLPASKSESNRALIIQALTNPSFELDNLASARDTQTMIRLLASEGHVLDVIDAGTTMRFLTAYFAVVGRDQILTGTPRMCKRPIGILVEALKSLGAEIEYWKQEGFPPLHIISKGAGIKGGKVSLPGNVSSQFISALLMIGPVLDGGLEIQLEGKITSRPYIEMTLGMMAYFGVQADWDEQVIRVPNQAYKGQAYTIESDWSAASYWYSMAALSEAAELRIHGLRNPSRQGDSRIAEIMEPFGVYTEYEQGGIVLTKRPLVNFEEVSIDFTDFPDLAQTMAVVSAATGKPLKLSGLHTLRIKETDRIAALQTELGKFDVKMSSNDDIHFRVSGQFTPTQSTIDTYEDHRMAMAFAPLVLKQKNLWIKDPDVVRKSYPEFWDHLKLVGIQISD